MKVFSILAAIAVLSVAVSAVPLASRQREKNVIADDQEEIGKILAQLVLTLDEILLSFENAYAQFESALSAAEYAGAFADVLKVVVEVREEADKIVGRALEAATPGMPLEELALLMQGTLIELALKYVDAVTVVEQIVEAEAVDALPEIHRIIIQLGEELENAVAPLVNLIVPHLPHH